MNRNDKVRLQNHYPLIEDIRALRQDLVSVREGFAAAVGLGDQLLLQESMQLGADILQRITSIQHRHKSSRFLTVCLFICKPAPAWLPPCCMTLNRYRSIRRRWKARCRNLMLRWQIWMTCYRKDKRCIRPCWLKPGRQPTEPMCGPLFLGRW